MESQFVWTDTQGDSGDITTIDGDAYLTLDMASTRPKAAAVCHSLDFKTAQAVAFHLAVAPAQPEPQPGEFWYVELVGSGGQRTICYIVKEDEFMCPALGRTVNPLDVVFVGRVPPARKGETQ